MEEIMSETSDFMELFETSDDPTPFLGFDRKDKCNGLTTSQEFTIMSLNCHNKPVSAKKNKRKKRQMAGPASHMKTMKNKQWQISSEEAYSVQYEVDDNDINVENVIDCAPNKLTGRIANLTSERFQGLSSSRINHGQDSLTGQVSDCNLSSDANTNGFQKSIELSNLTTQFLDFNAKTADLDRQLSDLKKEYEAKVVQIQAERKVYEVQIKNIVKLVHDWRDRNYADEAQISSNKSSPEISSLDKDPQQVRREPIKSIMKKSPSENRPKKKVCVEKPQVICYSPEPDINSGDSLEFKGNVSLESIDAELVCLSDMYGPQKSTVSVSKTVQEKPIKLALETSRGTFISPEKFTNEDIIKKMSPVVKLNDIYAWKKNVTPRKLSIGNIACGSYVIIKLSSKKKFEHYCAVVRSKSLRGEWLVQYMERKKNNEFIFPEKEIIYKIEEGDIVKVLQEPTVNAKGSRVYYSFPDNLVDIEAIK